MHRRGTSMFIGALLLSASAAQAQDAVRGEKRSSVCKACHAIKADDRRMYGPSLRGVFGRKAGTEKEWRSYSPALKNSNVVWDEESLARYIANPRAFIPGIRSGFAGFKNIPGLIQERWTKDLIAYLKEATR